MASHFSPATPARSILQPKLNPPKALLSIRDSYGGARAWKKCQPSTVNVCSWSSAASYVTPPGGAAKFSGNPIVVKKQLLQKRAGTVRAATIEEIEAEKSVIEKDAKGRMEKTIETVRSNFNSIRTGRASPAMLDKIEVDYYGSPVGLKSLAQISSPDGTSLLISPYDKSSLKSIEKAIVASDLGMTPNNDGEVIRLTLPQLTSDRRKELTKVVSKQAEEGKVALRNIRRDTLKAYEKLQKEKKLSEDTLKDFSSDLQKWTDEYVKKLDTISKQKEKVFEVGILRLEVEIDSIEAGSLVVSNEVLAKSGVNSVALIPQRDLKSAVEELWCTQGLLPTKGMQQSGSFHS